MDLMMDIQMLQVKKKFLCKSLKISEPELEDIRSTFRVFDADGDGEITVRDLGSVLSLLGTNPSKGQIKSMIAELDTTSSGSVNFKEFLMAQVRKKLEEQSELDDIKNAFKCIDDNEDGYITVTELQRAHRILGLPISRDEAIEIISKADLNGDGKIDFEEFVTSIMNSNCF